MKKSHFIVKCFECKKIINQCRCPSTDKEIKYIVCEDCKGKKEEKEMIFLGGTCNN